MPIMSCPLAELGRVALQTAILEGKIRHMGYRHKRKWKPLLAHREGVCCYFPLGGSKNGPLVPPGVCKSVSPHGGEEALVLGGKGG